MTAYTTLFNVHSARGALLGAINIVSTESAPSLGAKNPGQA